ncbi:MAG TPA: flagellar hook-length control protein FliK [Rhodocyclaceae bacterium]
MPQLNVAASPSPVVAPQAQANAAAGASQNAAASSAPEQPFATVLQHQMNNQAQQDKPANAADKTAAAQTPSAKPESDAAGANAQPAAVPDSLALIAQMLAGIAQPSQGEAVAQPEAAAGTAKAKKSTEDDEANPATLAAPLLPGLANPVPATHPAPEAATAGGSRALPDTGTAAKAAENLAADARGAASSAAPAESKTDFASAMAAAAQQQSAPINAQPAPSHAGTVATIPTEHVQSPVGTRGWETEMGDKLTWMVGKHESRADLVLNPPELGRIEVSISMKGDQASATFVSPNPVVRDALENAVPRLREVLQDAGITLGQAQVGAESFQQPPGSRENGDNSGRGNSSGVGIAASVSGSVQGASAAAALRMGNGLVDTFA